jgi:hypothetical protein
MKKTLLTALLLYLVAAGCASSHTVANKNQSTYFKEVSSHLDLGGAVYLYADIDGDIKKASEFFNLALKSSDEAPEEVKKKVDFSKITETFGLSDILAVGLSSVKKEDALGYHNKAFIKIKSPRKGFMNVMGKKAHPFEVLQMAPEGSGLVVEMDLNVKIIFDLIQSEMNNVYGTAKTDELFKDLKDPIPGTSLSLMKIIDNLNTKIMLIASTDNKKKVTIPEVNVKTPYVNMMMSIDNLGIIFDAFKPLLRDSPLFKYTHKGDFESFESVKPLFDDFSIYKPIIERQISTNRLYIASSGEYLETCLNNTNPITGDKNFAKATQNLNLSSGNFLSYSSAKFNKNIMKAVSRIFKTQKDLTFVSKLTQKWSANYQQGQASVMTNLPDGIYIESNTSDSHRSTLMLGPVFSPLTWTVAAATIFIAL